MTDIALPFKTEVNSALDSLIQYLEYQKERVLKSNGSLSNIYVKKVHDAICELTTFLNTGNFDDFGSHDSVIDHGYPGLSQSLRAATKYRYTYPNGLLSLIESAFSRTYLEFPKYHTEYNDRELVQLNRSDILKNKHSCISKTIPFLKCNTLHVYNDLNKTESGYDISNIFFNNSVCLQPSWDEEQCNKIIASKVNQLITESMMYNYKNIPLDKRVINISVYSINNPSISIINNLKLELPEFSKVIKITESHPSSEWPTHNVMYTIMDNEKNTEFYLSIFPIPLRNMRNILLSSCEEISIELNYTYYFINKKNEQIYIELTHAINNIINNLRSLHDCNVCISDQTFSNYRQIDLIKYIDIDIDTLSINNLRYLFQCYPVCKVMLRMLLIIKSYNFYIES